MTRGDARASRCGWPCPLRRLANRQFLQHLAVAFVGRYVVFAGALALLRGWLGAEKTPWAEVFYRPAVTLGSCYLLVAIGVWLECRIEQEA